MTWPPNYVQRYAPTVDHRDPTEGQRRGILPASLMDQFTWVSGERYPNQPFDDTETGFGGGSRPICTASPWAYDNAGITIGAGTLLVMSGSVKPEWFFFRRFGSSEATSRTVTVDKHLFPVRLRVLGLPVGCTGTVTIGHNADWSTTNPPDTPDVIWSFDGANGPDQEACLLTPLSVDATRRQSGSFIMYESWTGGAPRTLACTMGVLDTLNAQADVVIGGRLVPTTLHGDFTARAVADDDRGGYWGMSDRGYPCALRHQAPLVGPANWRFLLDPTITSHPFSGGTYHDLTATWYTPPKLSPASRHLGSQYFGDPDSWGFKEIKTSDWSEFVPSATSPCSLSAPCAWISGALRRCAYESRAFGPGVQIANDTTDSSSVGGGHAIGGVPVGASVVNSDRYLARVGGYDCTIAKGPGWLNLRVWLYGLVKGANITINSVTVYAYCDGVQVASTVVGSGFASMTGLEGVYCDLGVCAPAARTSLSKLAFDYTIAITAGMAGETISLSGYAKASPRRDIPLPWTTVGPDNSCAPGGYLAAALEDPLYSGGATEHKGLGVTSYVWPPIGTVVGGTLYGSGSQAMTFLPATDGVWRVENGTAPSQKVTLGEFDYAITGRTSALGRAGKRFWAHDPQAAHTTSDTWTLSAITQVQTAIPDSGLSILSGHLTDSNWFFGTIALPAAGTYRLSALAVALNRTGGLANPGIGPSLFLGIHRSDPYVIVPSKKAIHDPMPLGYVIAEQATPPGSPARDDQYLVATGGTGAWAGFDGQIMRYDGYRGLWRRRLIRPGYRYWYSQSEDSGAIASRWWDGAAWHASATDPVCTIDITVLTGATIYVRCGVYDPYQKLATDSIFQSHSSVTLSWEAL